ncbi:DUF4181 domain-containing protein [Paenibacillus sp. Marseille-P2973]|uniref:DUF4181 domain-containing protein n=1 Tax=Paenibacillus sp. Marseille-P2973 TaxID=1871032 RepID=UPI001B3689EC|nr:DUF4181 domain-containing protein [Paenibacillus sp. Marseille-P2973]MBQ4898829.1 DUF4181 domain-containing protein [Paenibacillus sp. Marseille-P2973]
MIIVICILLAFFHLILRICIVDKEQKELPEEGKELSIWSKLIFALIGIVAFIIILIADGSDGMAMKWFWMILVVVALGLQAFIDWKYIRASRQHIVSVIVLVLGVIMFYFWI